MSTQVVGGIWVSNDDMPAFRKGYERGQDFGSLAVKEGRHDPLRLVLITAHMKGFSAGYHDRMLRAIRRPA